MSVAPLSNEIRPVSSSVPPHLGPAIAEVSHLGHKLNFINSRLIRVGFKKC